MAISRLHPGHLLLAVLLTAVLLAGWRAVEAVRSSGPELPAMAPPFAGDRTLLARFDPFFPVRDADSAGLPVTALPLSLHGIRADSATGRGSAIIAGSDGIQKVHGVGDGLGGGVTLAAIAPDHVVLDRGGTREALWLDSAGSSAVQRFEPSSLDEVPPVVADADGSPMPESDAPASVAPGLQPVRDTAASAAGTQP